MSDRLHEIIAEIGVLHNEVIQNEKIKDVEEVFDYMEEYADDTKEHYLDLLLQYYFQKNDLNNLQKTLLVGAKFDMRFSDIKQAFLNIKSNKENVIEFMDEAVVFLKDTDLHESLQAIYDYYTKSKELQVNLEQALELIKRNRYVCSYCYKNKDRVYSDFFINEDLLQSLKRDLPYLLK